MKVVKNNKYGEKLKMMDWRNKMKIAKTEKSPHILNLLAKDITWPVRNVCALNMNLPRATLNKLTKDNNINVRESAIKKYGERFLNFNKTDILRV